MLRDVISQGVGGAAARELVEELSHALRVAEYGGVYANA